MIPIRAFVADIYRAGSITAAAQQLFISQPALSADLKRLENELGVTLFDRTTSPISLTDAGRVYVQALEDIGKISDDLQTQLDELKGLRAGRLSVGGAHFIASCLLLQLTRDFCRRYAGIAVDVFEGNSATLTQQVLQNELDLLLDYDFDAALFTAQPILRENILLCVPKAYARAGALLRGDIIAGRHLDTAPTDLAAFRDAPLILLRAGNNMYEHAVALCTAAGFTPHVTFSFDQLMTAYEAAVQGLGVTFVSDEIVRTVSDDDAVAYYPLAGEAAHRTLYIAGKKRRYCSSAKKTFIDFAAEYCQ